tara:strand:- start:84 stop:527 length:444 start_codon:yes stop_codon:yes gene_type:complete
MKNNFSKLKFLIIESRFYSDISDQLLLGAKEELDSKGILYDVISVSGSLEIPQAINIIVNDNKKNVYNGFIALGCVIRGETSHYDYVCSETMHWLNSIALKKNLCLGNGILTCENMEQAVKRSSISEGNKGRSAVLASLGLVQLKYF